MVVCGAEAEIAKWLIVARFEAERQALAMMDHTNIAKILDADVTDTGRPYFVMELVRGVKITDYCDQNQLSTKDRLDLFIKVCRAGPAPPRANAARPTWAGWCTSSRAIWTGS